MLCALARFQLFRLLPFVLETGMAVTRVIDGFSLCNFAAKSFQTSFHVDAQSLLGLDPIGFLR